MSVRRNKTCRHCGKVRLRSKGEAASLAREIAGQVGGMRNRRDGSKELYVYRCPRGAGWHLSSRGDVRNTGEGEGR